MSPSDYVEEKSIYWGMRSIVGEFHQRGLGFPLQKLILGKEAWDFFVAHPEDRLINNDFVAYILTRKLKDFLDGTKAQVELRNGQLLFSSHAPSLTLVDRLESFPFHLVGRFFFLFL